MGWAMALNEEEKEEASKVRSHCSLQTPKGTFAGECCRLVAAFDPVALAVHCVPSGLTTATETATGGREMEGRTARAKSKWQDPHALPLCVAKGLWISRVVLS